MKKENTASRLMQIMKERNLRQVDILELTKPYCKKYEVKMNKSDLSQYVSGKTEPNQHKLAILGMALNVSEAWLMGFDAPKERLEEKTNESSTLSKAALEVAAAYENADFDTKNNIRFFLKLPVLVDEKGLNKNLKTS